MGAARRAAPLGELLAQLLGRRGTALVAGRIAMQTASMYCLFIRICARRNPMGEDEQEDQNEESDDGEEYDRGHDDGVQAVHDATSNSASDSMVGEAVGAAGISLELLVADWSIAFESEAYQRGFRQGVRDTL
jgi:hypothetical protein